MTDRGPHPPDGTAACPFVAFDDDRDERSDRPDHRHRCYAEVPPAPRAIAHQEAYCLASAFPVCPTFQEWARREAARSREEGSTAPGSTDPIAAASPTPSGPQPASEWIDRRPPPVEEMPPGVPPRRNPPRDWAAPPPWASGAVVPGRATDGEPTIGGSPSSSASRAVPTEGRGLAGSAADRLARGESLDSAATEAVRPARSDDDVRSEGPDEGLARLVTRRPAAAPMPMEHGDPAGEIDDRIDDRIEDEEDAAPAWPARRRTVSSTRGAAAPAAPTWEEPRRFESYPTIKSRALDVRMPGIPRIAVLAAALAIAALALFFLPALMGVGGDDPDASPTPAPTTAVATPSPELTEPPAPTPQVYVIRSGDTLSRVARSFGVSLDDLLEANRDRIPNPDRISIGDEIIIPVTAPDDIVDPGSETAPEP